MAVILIVSLWKFVKGNNFIFIEKGEKRPSVDASKRIPWRLITLDSSLEIENFYLE